MSNRIFINDGDFSSSRLSIFNQKLADIFSNFYIDLYDVPFFYFNGTLPFNSQFTVNDQKRVEEELGIVGSFETKYDPIYGKLYTKILYFQNFNLYLRFEIEYESYEREIAGMYIEQVYPIQILQTVYQEDPNAVSHLCALPLEAPDLLKGL